MSQASVVVLCTCPNESVAAELGTQLVESRLAACVNMLPAVRSIYRWQGAIEKDDEVMLLIKTTQDRFKDLSEWLQREHPYDTPEIIALPVVAGSDDYLAWLAQQV